MAKQGQNDRLPSFMDAEPRRPYAQTLSRASQRLSFSTDFPLTQSGSTISNRDMGELMARDDAFREGIAHNGNTKNILSPKEDVEAIKALITIPKHDDTATAKPGSLYTPLPLNNHFRLLEILPGTDEARLQCRLHLCSMRDNRGAYEALSYTWMTGREQYEEQPAIEPRIHPIVECNGQEVTVGVNLYQALHRLRRDDGSKRVVWADALCIDQSNDRERSQQVAAMGDIFRNAYGVLVWLGADEDSAQISHAAGRASSKAFAGVCSAVETWAAAVRPALLSELPKYRVLGLEELGADGLLSAESSVWLDVLQLYNRRWFSRLWVVQEIALARRATAIWGACEMPWEWIGLAAAIIRTNWDRIVPGWVTAGGVRYRETSSGEASLSRTVPIGVMNAYFMYRISRLQRYFDPLRFSFCELLTLTRQFGCQDNRDKIFGLLGLPTTDHVNAHITPDYTQPLAKVYRSVASAMARSTKSLAFLSHVHSSIELDGLDVDWLYGTSSNAKEDPGPAHLLPSWVPLWHLPGPQTLTPLDTHPDFAAGMSKAAQFRGADEDSSNPDSLAVLNMVLEEVSAASGVGSLDDCDRGGDLGIVLAQFGHTRRSPEKLAMTLAAGKSWYGTPKDRAGMLADFADCLVGGHLWWALKPDAFGSRDSMPVAESGAFGKESGSPNQRDLENDNTISSSADPIVTMQDLKDMSMGGNGNLFLDAVGTACIGRRLFTTVSGMRGVGPWDTRPGDLVCVIYGCAMPFIIRPCENGSRGGYRLVGECYIDDIMHGEAVGHEKYEETWIELI